MREKHKYLFHFEEFAVPYLFFLAVSIFLFHAVVTGEALLVGNADRLNHMMAFSRLHSQNIRNYKYLFWDDLMLGGIDSISLNFNIWSLFYSLFSTKYFMQVTACAAIIQLSISGFFAFYSLRQFGISRIAAISSAICFQCSSLSILQVTQHDFTFLVLLISPLVWLYTRKLEPNNLVKPFISLTIVLLIIGLFGFLQSVAYLLIFIGMYGFWRSYIASDFRPFIAVLLSEVVCFIGITPRLIGSLEDSKQLKRNHFFSGDSFIENYDFQNIRFWEITRFFSNKIFGNYPSEAAQLGNNINLTEGMLLNSSVIASVLAILAIVFIIINRDKKKKIIILTDAPIMAFFLVLSISVVILWPVNWLFYNIFFQKDFTHSRVIVAACFPLALLTGMIMDVLIDRIDLEIDSGSKKLLYSFCIFATLSGFTIPILSQNIVDRFKLSHISLNGRFFSPSLPKPSVKPISLVAQRLGPEMIELSWNFSGSAYGYYVTKSFDGKTLPVNFVKSSTSVLRLPSVSLQNNYIFSVLPCNPLKCYEGLSVEVPIFTTGQSNRYYSKKFSDLTSNFDFVPPNDHMLHLKTSVIVETVVLGIIALSIIVYCFYFPRSPISRSLIYSFIFLTISNTIYNGERELNSWQLYWQTGKPAFYMGDSMLAHPDDFTDPDTYILKNINHELSNNSYRTIFLCDPLYFNTFCASHMAHFWHLRSLDGYGPGVPAGIAGFPWPNDELSMRALTFSSQEKSLPWLFLGINNVKYAILVTPDIYRNRHEDHNNSRKAELSDFKVFENPQKVTPRVFLVSEARPAIDPKQAVNSLLDSANIDPEALSYVVGLSNTEKFDVSGEMEAVFEGDKISIQITPSIKSRLLILNENWHPGWKARLGEETISVMQANGSMRAIILKPGTRSVTISYEPVYFSILSIIILIVSLLIFVISAIFLQKREAKILNSY